MKLFEIAKSEGRPLYAAAPMVRYSKVSLSGGNQPGPFSTYLEGIWMCWPFERLEVIRPLANHFYGCLACFQGDCC